MVLSEQRIHEVDFCSQMAAAANHLVAQNPAVFPFHEVRVEGYGSSTGKNKRKDLRFFDRHGKLVLCGEVKLPGTVEGQSAMNQTVMADAAAKADEAGVKFFFTWNVNEFALWDRSLWDRPWFERRVRVWRLARTLPDSEAVAREANLNFIKTDFLPDLLREVGEIISGRRTDWEMPPDDVFIRALESHLDWPVILTSSYIFEQSNKDKAFGRRVEEWMGAQDRPYIRSIPEEWMKAVDNMAKTVAYVWANRLIFYKALRARFPDLPRLELKASLTEPDEALAALNGFFKKAVKRSGDYESLMMPDSRDWAAELVFHAPSAIDAWRGLLRNIEAVDFKEVPSDVVGRIFQKLIGPDERHRYGQHFTGDDAVDLINAFCIRDGADSVLDPSCGSGSFLVRAYYRKRHLDAERPHVKVIGELFGCDISMYPAHLATLNLAAREINEEANYPRIVRKNFFDFEPKEPFCLIPEQGNPEVQLPIRLPLLDAVVGNPPYVRQEKVEKKDKARFGAICADAFPGLRLTGRSDLHCYFWPAAARLLKPNGYFGFLTSSSWMDVEYGFALQGWMLSHFKILAVMESAAEAWFDDARVKTCVAILQRCDDETARMENTVRFVRLTHKLADILGVTAGQDERKRQRAMEALRKRILNAKADRQEADLRIIVKRQGDLWADGVRAGAILRSDAVLKPVTDLEDADGEEDAEENEAPDAAAMNHINGHGTMAYRAGKWGRYVRAPEIYFEVMKRFASRFVPLGEIASIRRGITSGCDAFFMPRDVTEDMLSKHETDRAFREQTGGAPRRDAESGKLRIIQAGDGSVHPIEARFIAPEVHSMMKVDRPVVQAKDLDRVVILISDSLAKLKSKAPWAWRYLSYGMSATFPSKKSKSVPVPERSSCAGRTPWYDLTKLSKPGIAFWPMAQQYRHIIAANPERLICNHNLFDIAANDLQPIEQITLIAILNSTLIGLFKTFYGRFAGTEGNLKTEVVDVNLLEIPDPRGVPPHVAKRLADALERMGRRDVGRLIEEQLMDCHTPDRAHKLAAGPVVLANELKQSDRRDLDDAVFELLGVSNAKERATLIDRLYEATATHFRAIRVVEIEKMEQRAKSETKRFSVNDLAADIWDAAELEDALPLAQWIGQQHGSDASVNIPEDRPAVLSEDLLYSPNAVHFGRGQKNYIECESRGQAELVVRLANLGVNGDVKLPGALAPAMKLLDRSNTRILQASARFEELAESRTGDERMRQQLVDVLGRWFVLGRGPTKSRTGN